MDIETLIVVVTYNSSGYIENCINSILASDYKKWFLTIIDNNSSDDTAEKITELTADNISGKTGSFSIADSKNFKLLKMVKNAGFARAVNYSVYKYPYGLPDAGLNHVKNLILINPDLCIEENTLSELLHSLGCMSDCGAAGGLIYDYEGKKVQHAGGRVEDNYITSHIVETTGNKISIYPVDYVTGALFATKMDVFKDLGGFDTGYRPAYFEELDYCRKLYLSGLKPYINLNACAKHFEGASSGKFSYNFYRYYHKNRIRCAIINYGFIRFFNKFIPSEIKWLRLQTTKDQRRPLFEAYFLNFVFLFYNLMIKIRNFFIIKRLKEKQHIRAEI